MRSVLRLLVLLGLWALSPRCAAAAKDDQPVARAVDPFEEGLSHFQARRYLQAARSLERARQQQPTAEVLLLLGISFYRGGDAGRAEPVLREASMAKDEEIAASARLFLALVHREQGALDRAQADLSSLAGSRTLGPSARGLLQGIAPRRLQGSLVLSPEFDGNVALTNLETWRGGGSARGDGDLLLIGSLSARPFQGIGLGLGTTLAYRQQFQSQFQAYNLLLSTTWLGYSYLGDRHRLRASGSFTFSMLGRSTLYLEGEGRATYRLRLVSHLGLLLGYTGRYRGYERTDFAPFTGHTHTGLVELGWGLSPSPVSVNLAYQVQREQLAQGAAAEDFRAIAHGPSVRLAAQLHRRVELGLVGSLLQRRFDVMPVGGALRHDLFLLADLSLTVDLKRWLDAFCGFTMIYNSSNDAAFTYVKPIAYVGLTARFAAF